MYQYLCDVCTTKLLNTPIQLGSQDVVKAKYRFKEMKGVSSHLLPRRKNGVWYSSIVHNTGIKICFKYCNFFFKILYNTGIPVM
jgi:hypothetical protein